MIEISLRKHWTLELDIPLNTLLNIIHIGNTVYSLIETMTSGEQPLRVYECPAALEVSVAVERGLPGPRARRRAVAAHDPAPTHVLVSYIHPTHSYCAVHISHYIPTILDIIILVTLIRYYKKIKGENKGLNLSGLFDNK